MYSLHSHWPEESAYKPQQYSMFYRAGKTVDSLAIAYMNKGSALEFRGVSACFQSIFWEMYCLIQDPE